MKFSKQQINKQFNSNSAVVSFLFKAANQFAGPLASQPADKPVGRGFHTASFQKFSPGKWAQPLGDLYFQKAC